VKNIRARFRSRVLRRGSVFYKTCAQ